VIYGALTLSAGGTENLAKRDVPCMHAGLTAR
jgi:hypothetical protein